MCEIHNKISETFVKIEFLSVFIANINTILLQIELA